MPITAAIASLPEASHHHATLNGVDIHYVSSGHAGSPVLLVHGFPESWWTFHKLIPLLATKHRIIAADLPGFGDSDNTLAGYTSAAAAGTLGLLIEHIGLGPVHLTGQDISGPTTFRLASVRPDLVRSYSAIETGLPGFGLELLADVAHGGTWHIGMLAAPGIPEMLLTGRERQFLAGYAYPSMCTTAGAITEQDIDEFTRTYSRPNGFGGASGLYRSMLEEGDDVRELVARGKLQMPVLAVGGGSGAFTHHTMTQVAENVTPATLPGVGHLVALEAPEALSQTLLTFYQACEA